MTSLHALAGTLLYEGFEGTNFPPAGWLRYRGANDLGGTHDWLRNSDFPYEGDAAALVVDEDVNGVAEDWLVTPQIALGPGSILTFYQRQLYTPDWGSQYLIKLSTSSQTNRASFVTVASYGETNFSKVYSRRTVDLGAFAGSHVFLAFVMVNDYGDGWLIDNVQVADGPAAPSAFTATPADVSLMQLSWRTNASGDRVMIAENAASQFGIPADGTQYGAGDTLSGGGTVLYSGTALAAPSSNLAHSTWYSFRAWSVNAATQYSGCVDAHALTFEMPPVTQGFNAVETPRDWSSAVIADIGTHAAPELTFVTDSVFPTATPSEGGRFGMVNSLNCDAGDELRLMSYNISSMGGYSEIAVAFAWYEYHDVYSTPSEGVYVQCSTNNGASWTSIGFYTNDGVPAGWKTQRCVVPAAFLDQPNLRIAFLFHSGYGYNMYLDDVKILGVVPGVYLLPGTQYGSNMPATHVTYPLALQNLSGTGVAFSVQGDSIWPFVCPLSSGLIANASTTTFVVRVDIPASAYAGDTCTTTVRAISADNRFTNAALLITRCDWTYPFLFSPFATGLEGWTNYQTGAASSDWYFDGAFACVAHDRAASRAATNWLVSPAVNCAHATAEFLTVGFDFGCAEARPMLYPECLYVSTSSRNPSSGGFAPLFTIQDDAGYFLRNEADIQHYIGSNPVYFGITYIGTNPWQLVKKFRVQASRIGIDNSRLVAPSHVSLMSYAATPAITGAIQIANQTGVSGPAARVHAQLGWGLHGSSPEQSWEWADALYSHSDAQADYFVARAPITSAGSLDFCYRFRVGDAPFAYADLDGSANGYSALLAGNATITMLPPRGVLLAAQTVSANWRYAPTSCLITDAQAAIYYEAADDFSFTADSLVRSLRWGGVYWNGQRTGMETGFVLRIYENVATNPGVMVHEQFIPGYACEQFFAQYYGTLDDFYYHADVSPPFPAQAGHSYWWSVQHIVAGATRWSVLDTPDAAQGNPAMRRSTYSPAWETVDNLDLGIELYGEVTNAGFVAGTVVAAHSGAPLSGVVIAVSNADYRGSVVSGAAGAYCIAVPPGTYDVHAAMQRYLPAVTSGVTTAVGASNAVDFVLRGSELFFAPTNLFLAMRFSQVLTNTIVISNTGPLAVSYLLTLQHFSTSAATTAAATCAMPDGEPRRELSRAPRRAAFAQPGGTPERAWALPGVSAYAFNLLSDPNDLLSFNTATPGTLQFVTHSGIGGSEFVAGADFLYGDFSTLYAMTSTGRFVKINATTGAVTPIRSLGGFWSGLTTSADGDIYASTATRLYRISADTGAATLLGIINGNWIVVDIAMNAKGELYGVDIANDQLVKIHAGNGSATPVGPLGVDLAYAQGMDFDDVHGTLYIAAYNATANRAELRAINTATGAATLVGVLGNGAVELDGFAIKTTPRRWVSMSTNVGNIAAGAVSLVRLTFDAGLVSNPGAHRATLNFTGDYVNDAGALPLCMSVHGAQINLPQPSINFGEVVTDTSATQTVAIANIGDEALTGAASAVALPFALSPTNYAAPGFSTTHLLAAFSPTNTLSFTNAVALAGGGGATLLLMGTGVPEAAVPFLLLLWCLIARPSSIHTRVTSGI